MRLTKYYFSTLASVAILVAPYSHAIARKSVSFSPALSGPTELFGRPIRDKTNGNLIEIICIYKSEATSIK